MKKNKHQYHPPTPAEAEAALKSLSKSDQLAIRTGIRAATTGIQLEETLGFAVANALTINPPRFACNFLTATRIAADRVSNNTLPSHVMFDLFGGDQLRTKRAFEEFEKVTWFLDYAAETTPLRRNYAGEGTLKSLSSDARVIVREWIKQQLDYYDNW